MSNNQNIPVEMAKKVPDFNTYNASPAQVVQYVFMLLFIGYLAWKELISRDDCKDRITTVEHTLKNEREMNKTMMSRIRDLEKALDVKNGVIREVEQNTKGGSI